MRVCVYVRVFYYKDQFNIVKYTDNILTKRREFSRVNFKCYRLCYWPAVNLTILCPSSYCSTTESSHQLRGSWIRKIRCACKRLKTRKEGRPLSPGTHCIAHRRSLVLGISGHLVMYLIQCYMDQKSEVLVFLRIWVFLFL